CLLVPAGTDPLNQCTASPRASCGLDGQCDGAGNCRMWSVLTSCGPRTCSGDSTVTPSFCNGSGSCNPGISVSCGTYTCQVATGTCYTSCSADAQCAAGFHCKKMKCV